jgi:hypothetical protein
VTYLHLRSQACPGLGGDPLGLSLWFVLREEASKPKSSIAFPPPGNLGQAVAYDGGTFFQALDSATFEQPQQAHTIRGFLSTPVLFHFPQLFFAFLDRCSIFDPHHGLLSGSASAFFPVSLTYLSSYERVLAADDTTRAIIIQGEGKAFAAGTDIQQFQGFTGEDGVAYEHKMEAIVERLYTITKPTIAAIHGNADSFGAMRTKEMLYTARLLTVTDIQKTLTIWV